MSNERTNIHNSLISLCNSIEAPDGYEIIATDSRQQFIECCVDEVNDKIYIIVEFSSDSFLENEGTTCSDSWDLEYQIIAYIRNVCNNEVAYELMENMQEKLQDPPRKENNEGLGLPCFVTYGRITNFNMENNLGIDANQATGINVICSYRISYRVYKCPC